jgi:hypothetical protein
VVLLQTLAVRAVERPELAAVRQAVRAAQVQPAKQAAANPAVVVPAAHQVAEARRNLRSVCLPRVLVALQLPVCRTQALDNLAPVVPLALMAERLALHHHLLLLRRSPRRKVAAIRPAKAFSLDRVAERQVRAREVAVPLVAPAVAKRVAAQAAA